MRQVADGTFIVVGIVVIIISFRVFRSNSSVSMLFPRTRCTQHPIGLSSACLGRLELNRAGTGLRRGSKRGPAGIGVDGRTVFVCRATTAPTRCQHALDQ